MRGSKVRSLLKTARESITEKRWNWGLIGSQIMVTTFSFYTIPTQKIQIKANMKDDYKG